MLIFKEDPRLRLISENVTDINEEIFILAHDMLTVMNTNNGIGIAAPQLGVNKRVIIVKLSSQKPLTLVNPVILNSSGKITTEEGCLSIPGVFGKVTRSESINIEASNLDGKINRYAFKGRTAVIVQHEIDHLDGILFVDKLIE